MKLLFINYGTLPLPPVKGGAVEHLIDMFLIENEKNYFHDITVVSIYDKEAEKITKNYKRCKFEYIKLDGFIDKLNRVGRHLINKLPFTYVGNAYIRKVIEQIDNFERYDAVIIENAPEFGLILRKLVKGKLILHLHNDYLNKDTKLSKKIFNCFDEIYTLSEFVGNRVRQISKSNKVQTLYNGVDLQLFNKENYSKNKRDIKKKYRISEDDIVIMYSGRLVPEKGVKELIQAFLRMPKKKNIKLLIVGSAKYGETVADGYFSSLKKLSKQNPEQIIFTGYIPYNEMPHIYSIADIGVVPSLCNDGFNLTVVEFMANSIPVIVSDRGAMKELITPDCGIVVPTSKGDFSEQLSYAIQLLIQDKNKYELMKRNALQRSKMFSKKNYCNRFNYLLNR